MSISDELTKLTELRRIGTLSDAEFEVAKLKALSDEKTSVDAQQLEELTFQSKLAKLERNWDLERRQYMVVGKYGQNHIPSKTTSIIGGIVIIAFGMYWLAISLPPQTTGDSPSPLIGIASILIGVGVSVYCYRIASHYETAEKGYRERRATLHRRRRKS